MSLLFTLIVSFSFTPIAAPEVDARAAAVEMPAAKGDLWHSPMRRIDKTCR